ncbi:unnamed protein product [Vitrella brassicaformis CCMP3155]|uniref:Glucose-methanol-choline oxidoreductase N-terminal domain-containing protein n=2 Tax=Vitrella brassicaformis TaxID=1169539 RepID=A0A0G4FKR5_VITBC|nr:unnamed protein product [Vitrella brassicaformis CCMP3155]|eukprot:CEM14550.1 unnamed protein product [Vitrella brassicaformis CCMP3155]
MVSLMLCGHICCADKHEGSFLHEPPAGKIGGKDAAYFDYIVVGGGAAGCPLAFTLAEDGYRVLLIERGGNLEEHPEAVTPWGWGPGLNNPDLAQQIRTIDRTITHVGNVLSGGTALTAGLQIAEVAEYFDYLEHEFGAQFDQCLVDESYAWIFDQTSQPMGKSEPYSSAARKAQEAVGFNPVTDPSPYITLGSFRTYSRFEDDGGVLSPYRKRFGADVLLKGPLADPPGTPASLEVMLRKTVLRIDFDTSGKQPRATCIEYVDSPGPPESIDSYGNRAGSSSEGWPQDHHDVKRACINPGGEIFLSTGAIMTPVLLMNSGVGPFEVVSKVMANKGGEVVMDIPQLGSNLHDRFFTPLMVFLEHDTIPEDKEYQNVTLGTYTGFEKMGADCPTDFGIGDVSMDCMYVNSEEGSGFSALDLFLATRAFLPTVLRTTPETDLLVSVVSACNANQDSLLCLPLRPVFDCLKKVVGFMSFPPVPKSRGHVTVNEWGAPIVFGNYFGDHEGLDIHSAVMGLTTSIRMVGSGEFDGVLQEKGIFNCPGTIFNHLLDMILIATRPLAGIRHLKASHEEAAGPDRQEYENFVHQRRLEMEMEAKQREGGEAASRWLGAESDVAKWLTEQVEMAKGSTAPARSLQEDDVGSWRDDVCAKDNHGHDCMAAQLEAARRFAVVPPLPADLWDAEELGKFVKSAGTGIWHWVGSAAMGTVVDSDFRVYGIDALSICDASVLPQVTRLNVQATVLMLGRYAGLRRRREKKHTGVHHHREL